MSTTTTPTPKRLNILMLHGYTQSGPLFHVKTRALEKNLKKAFPAPHYNLTLHYPTGPCIITAPDVTPSTNSPDATTSPTAASANTSSEEESYGWFQRKGEAESTTAVYTRLEEGLSVIAETMRKEGPFDGVVGFSQGGFMAGIVASLLDVGRREAFDDAERKGGGMAFPASFLTAGGDGNGNGNGNGSGCDGRADDVFHAPLNFAVTYSGFHATPNPIYNAFYSPKITTPMLHFIGTMDTVVEEARSIRLVDATSVGRDSEVGKRRVVYHPGGHFLPASQRQCLLPLVGFVKECMGWDEQVNGAKGKGAEELDLPF